MPARSSTPQADRPGGLFHRSHAQPEARGSFQRLSDTEALWEAFGRVRREKRRTTTVAAFDLEADRHVLALHRDLRAGRYRHGDFRLHVIRDPKTRLIAAAPVRDRVLHQALVTELAPAYAPSFLDQHYACGTGRGPQRAVLRYLSWMRRYRCRLSLDIRRYFPSIRQDLLLGLFDHRLRDPDTRALLAQLLEVGGRVYQTALAREALGLEADPVAVGCGLPIGSYLSQWSGGFYLDGLDHYIKRELRVPGYLRYMDDLALFGDDAGELERARGAIEGWLRDERALRLNPKRWEVLSTQVASVFLGYRVSRGGLSPGPKQQKRLALRVRVAAKEGPAALARTLQSYRAIFLF